MHTETCYCLRSLKSSQKWPKNNNLTLFAHSKCLAHAVDLEGNRQNFLSYFPLTKNSTFVHKTDLHVTWNILQKHFPPRKYEEVREDSIVPLTNVPAFEDDFVLPVRNDEIGVNDQVLTLKLLQKARPYYKCI